MKDQKPSGELQGKLDYGDGKELYDSSDTTETHCTESSPEIDNNLQVCDYNLMKNYFLLHLRKFPGFSMILMLPPLLLVAAREC